jgi:hypothetical protein
MAVIAKPSFAGDRASMPHDDRSRHSAHRPSDVVREHGFRREPPRAEGAVQ